GGSALTACASSSNSSVVSPIALTATTTALPAFLVSTTRRATRLMASASATEEPPYFCTTRDIQELQRETGRARRQARAPILVVPDGAAYRAASRACTVTGACVSAGQAKPCSRRSSTLRSTASCH